MTQIAEHAEVALTQHHRFRAFTLALQQPVGGKVGQNIVDAVVEEVLAHTGKLHEAVVAPEDLLRVGTKDHHRGLVGGSHIIGHIVDVFANALAALLRRVAEVPPEECRCRSLADGERNAHARCDSGERKANDKIQPEAGIHQLADPFVLHKKLPSRPGNKPCGSAQGITYSIITRLIER